MSTLDYAARAKDIQNKPQVNQMLNKKTVIAEYVADIERLKSALHAARLKNGIFLPQEEFSRLNETVELQKAEVEEARRGEELLQNQITRLREQFEHNMGELLGTKASLEEQTRHMEETKEILRNTEITLSDTTTKLKEETTLRKAHQKTETELGAAAHDLLATARSTTSDIDGLRAKIGRMANVEVENHSSWMRSSSQVSQVTHALEDAVDLFKDEQANISSDISQRIASFVEAEKNTLQDAYNFVEQRFADFQATADAGLTTTHERQRDTDLILQEILTLRVDLKTRIGNGLRGLNDAAKRMAEDVIIDLGNFGAEVHISPQFHSQLLIRFSCTSRTRSLMLASRPWSQKLRSTWLRKSPKLRLFVASLPRQQQLRQLPQRPPSQVYRQYWLRSGKRLRRIVRT